MRRNENSRIKNIVFGQAAYFFIGAAVLVLVAYPLFKKASQQYGLNKEIGELNREISELEGKSRELRGIISYLESDEFAEETARLNLNLKKEGEEVVVITGRDNGSSPDRSGWNKDNLTKEKKDIPNPLKWWYYFFN